MTNTPIRAESAHANPVSNEQWEALLNAECEAWERVADLEGTNRDDERIDFVDKHCEAFKAIMLAPVDHIEKLRAKMFIFESHEGHEWSDADEFIAAIRADVERCGAAPREEWNRAFHRMQSAKRALDGLGNDFSDAALNEAGPRYSNALDALLRLPVATLDQIRWKLEFFLYEETYRSEGADEVLRTLIGDIDRTGATMPKEKALIRAA